MQQHTLTKEKNLETMLTIAVGFIVLFFVFEKIWLLYIALGIGLIGMFSDFLSSKISWAWYKLAEVLGMIVPKILLSIVFYLFLFPIALLSRIGSKDPMKLKKGYTSYYSDRTTEFKKEDFEKTW
jgi:hypothetical protein